MIIEYKNLNITIEVNKVLFSNLNLTINEHDRVCIVGKNGCGKSTLIKKIFDINKKQSEQINLNVGFDEVAYIPQDYRNAWFPWLTIKSNFNLFLNKESNILNTNLPKEIEDNLIHFMNILEINLDLNKYPYELSGGEQQILLFLRGIMKSPRLFIADEPFSAIDYHKKEQIEVFFNQIISQNKITTLIVSHDIEQAVLLSNRIILLTKKFPNEYLDIEIKLPYPRNRSLIFDENFIDIISLIKNNFE